MLERSGFIYKIVSIGVAILCLLSCAPQPELEWVPKIKSQSATVTDNVCVLMAEASTDLADGYSCGFFYGKTEDNMHRVKAKADGKNFEYTLYSLDHETEYLYKAYVSNGRNEICSDIRHFRTLKEAEPPRSMTLPFNTMELDSEETEFIVEVGGDADFTINIPDTVSWIFYRRDNRNCRFQVKRNTKACERRCGVVFTNLFDNQSDTLVVVQGPYGRQEGDYVDEYGINHGQGIRIGQTVWAPVNCGYHETDFKWGKLYQWGRKYGQGYNGELYETDWNQTYYSDASVPEFEAGPVSLEIGQSKENENKFFCPPNNSHHWCIYQNDDLWNFGTEENPVKTQYDPCPDGWRVPTYAELYALVDNHSSWTTDEKGQIGYWFSGPSVYTETVPQVFFPASGYRPKNGDLGAHKRGYNGFYWSSKPTDNDSVSLLYFLCIDVGVDVGTSRATGCSLRCVQDDSALIPVASIALSKTSMSLSVGNSETIRYSITPSNANHQSAHWWSDNPEIASVDQNGNVAGVSGGATIIYAMAGMQVATCSVTVTGTSNPGDYIDEYGINHGPGVKIGETVWAPVNCGYHATDFRYGKLYQWGRKYGQGYDGPICDEEGYHIGISSDISEPELVEGPVSLAEGQSESNANLFYLDVDGRTRDWCTPSDDRLWNSGTEESPVKTEYDPCPSGWRVPTYAELDELSANYSSWTTDENGQSGYWFSGPNVYTETAPQVFLSAAGYRSQTQGWAVIRGAFGYYWSSRPMDIYPDSISILYFMSLEVGVDVGSDRPSGFSVRCVIE